MGVRDDMIVGGDVAVFRNDEARAGAATGLIVRNLELLEKILHPGRDVAQTRCGASARLELFSLDRHDGWRHVFGDSLERLTGLFERPNFLRCRFGRRRCLRLRPADLREIEAGSEDKTAGERYKNSSIQLHTSKLRHD